MAPAGAASAVAAVGPQRRLLPRAGPRAYLDDVPGAELHLLEGGPFALDEHMATITDLVADFLTRHGHGDEPGTRG